MMSIAHRLIEQDRADLRRLRRKHERDTMTEDEIDRRVTAAILEAFRTNSEITGHTWFRCNIRQGAVTQARFKRCLERASAIEPRIADREFEG